MRYILFVALEVGSRADFIPYYSGLQLDATLARFVEAKEWMKRKTQEQEQHSQVMTKWKVQSDRPRSHQREVTTCF